MLIVEGGSAHVLNAGILNFDPSLDDYFRRGKSCRKQDLESRFFGVCEAESALGYACSVGIHSVSHDKMSPRSSFDGLLADLLRRTLHLLAFLFLDERFCHSPFTSGLKWDWVACDRINEGLEDTEIVHR